MKRALWKRPQKRIAKIGELSSHDPQQDLQFNHVWSWARTNHRLLDTFGCSLTKHRPEVQFRDSRGHVHIIETQVSELDKSLGAKRDHYIELFINRGWKGTFNGEDIP